MEQCPRCGFAEADYITTTEALELLGVSDQTVRNWAAAGRFPGAVRSPVGDKRWWIPRAAVEKVRAEEEARGAA